MQSRYYPLEFKYKVLQDMFDNHLTLQEMALKYGLPSPSTVLMWKRKYNKKGLSGLNDGSRIWSESMVKKMIQLPPTKRKIKSWTPVKERKKDLLKAIEFLKAEKCILKKMSVLVQERMARKDKNGLPPSKNEG
jgi:transposase